MTKLRNNKWVQLMLRVVLAALFIYAGVRKVIEPLAFADSIATFALLPQQLINILALGLPVFEILAGAAILAGAFRRQAAFCLLCLTVLFAAALLQAIARGLEIDCGCFGSGAPSKMSAWITLGRDLLLFVVAYIVYVHEASSRSASQPEIDPAIRPGQNAVLADD